MAANEFEKNVRKEMDEFKLHPSEEVWTKIEERISENRRKRRTLFFILSSLIALTLGGYGIYNLSVNKTKSEAQDKLSQDNRPNDKNSSKSEELNKETITIKPNIPFENIRQTHKPLVVAKQKQESPTYREDKLLASISKENRISKDQTTLIVDKTEEKKESGKKENTNEATVDVSPFNQQQIETNRQNDISKPADKNLKRNETALNSGESKDTRSVEVMNKEKSGEVSTKITWGINFSAGRSVITEEAFSFKSSYAAADRQYSAPGTSQGGGPVTGGGGSGNPGSSYTYPQSQNEPAFAFKAGIHARKDISKRSSLSAGLGYSYLADKITIGTNQATSQSSMALYYYSGSPQKTHTDHFHFIELPLTYNWRVTNNTDHFLSLNAGIAPSYLLSTNALLYDTTMGGIYYNNKDLVTKTHFNFISGLSYQFRNKKRVEFSLGPQFSFDVTKVFKSDLDKRKYFFYTGIDARVFFQKKK